METRIYTFGSNQYDPFTGKHLLGFYATVTTPTAEICEQVMRALFGEKWSTDYPSVEAAGGEEYGLIEHVRIVLGATPELVDETRAERGERVEIGADGCGCPITEEIRPNSSSIDGTEHVEHREKCWARPADSASADVPPVHYRFGMHDTACGLKPGEVPAATADHAKVTCKACIDGLPF